MKTKMLCALVLVALVGCSPARTSQMVTVQGPSAADQDHALQLVWEGVYGMKRETRPPITWWQACPDGHENEPCYDEFSLRGDVNLIWVGTNPTTGAVLTGQHISDTEFSVGLESEREWNTYPPGELAPEAEAARLTEAAQNALRAASL